MKQPDIKPYIIGITGQTGSGKTFVIKQTNYGDTYFELEKITFLNLVKLKRKRC